MGVMPDPTVNRLASLLSPRRGQPRIPTSPVAVWRKATVVTVQAGANTCSLTLGASATLITNVKFPPHYVPTIGDHCWVILSSSNGTGPADIVVVQQHV